MEKIYAGTAGWSYKDWIGSFYPKGQSKDFDMLEFYSTYFNCIEVNSTYYTYINPKIVEGWINKVEDREDFLFTIKLHQDFTHKKNYTKEQVKSVQYNLDMLQKAERLGGLLLQFPYSFKLDKENANHVKNLLEIFSGYDKFVEVRHKSWFIERFFEFISRNRSSLCAIDQPVLGEAIEFSPVCAGDNLYIRFHGRNHKAWAKSINNFGTSQSYEQQSERYDYLYSPGELTEIEQKVKEVLDAVKKVFIIFNNHPHGDAVANALELLNMLAGHTKVKVPDTMLKAYPRLSKISLN
jgi:uncharacterized protein YecE (DUF72 family)